MNNKEIQSEVRCMPDSSSHEFEQTKIYVDSIIGYEKILWCKKCGSKIYLERGE